MGTIMQDTTNGTALAVRDDTTRDIASIDLTAIERVIVAGDLSKLSPDERWSYYQSVCRSVGLNPFTQPFAYINLSGKLVLYAQKGATEQLRRIYGVSLSKPEIQFDSGLVIVTVSAKDGRGRSDTDIGAVNIDGLRGEARANAVMKAITKAKRRTTLSICGLGMLDESEADSIAGAQIMTVDQAHGQQPALPEKTPAETFMASAWSYESDSQREEAEEEYTRLVGVAVEHGHKHAEKLQSKAAADLKDGELHNAVATLQRWEAKLQPQGGEYLLDEA